MTLTIGNLQPHHQGRIILNGGIYVHLIYQQTPFGQRRYFMCPCCTRKCAKLHMYGAWWHCQSCIPIRLYRKRQDLYDNGGTALVRWHLNKLLRDNGLRNLWNRPRGMHHRRFENIRAQYRILLDLLGLCAVYRFGVSAGFIKHLLSVEPVAARRTVHQMSVNMPRQRYIF